MKQATFFSAVTYLLTYLAMGIYLQPSGPHGAVLWLGFPLALVASTLASIFGMGRMLRGDWE